MPQPIEAISWSEEPVIFENWEEDGCHIFANDKHVLTLNTPESLSAGFLDDWISSEEFCELLEKLLRGLGASEAVIARITDERTRYRDNPPVAPTRTNAELLEHILANH